ncbi:acyl-CoA dehydrogenase family protein [Clostridium felsineum]|uniref:acyl-CoA dehydrogenase family protein n=1 Tax=Clostridium felsineum TaxID=36839 RepID=UPI00098C5157|nr:acyl-CoA dehydrogenase family protein [Clostridium felsineum]URZ15105.1 Acyl-CoA dehydrogenase [Clostridium felsineum DSM 794]
MDFKLTKEQKEYTESVINFARQDLNDSEYLEKFSFEMWKKVSDFGLLGITISEKYGGLQESYLTAALVFEALGYACKNNGFVFVINNHIWVAQNIINLYASDLLKDKYIPSMVQGEKIGAIAITEAEFGSDALGMKTKAVCDGDNYILNGTKMFISNGPIADIFIVFAVTQTEPVKKITAFVVEKDYEGVTCGADIEKMGLNACPTSEIIFNNVKVPKENIIGKLNRGSNIMTCAIEWERCYEFAPHVGAMQRIMEICLEQAKKRKQFGNAIEKYQAVSHKIAEMQVRIEMAKLMLYKIAWLKDNNRTAYLETSVFKLFVSENYIKTCRDAIQIFGAYGYTKEYDVEREMRDALACSIYSGTNEMQKNTIYNMINIKY